MRIKILLLLFVLVCIRAFAQAPMQRNRFTTNIDASIPIADTVNFGAMSAAQVLTLNNRAGITENRQLIFGNVNNLFTGSNFTGGTFSGSGSVLTNIIWIDPTRYGAAGDGVTDDTIALTNCFWLASISNMPVVLSKKFLFSGRLNIYTNTTIYGYGGVLKCASGTSFPFGVAIQTDLTSTNIHISGIEIDGGNVVSIPTTDDGRTGLLIFSTQNPNCSYDHLFVHGFGKGVRVFDAGANGDPQLQVNNITCRGNFVGFMTDTGSEYVPYTSIISQENATGAWVASGNNHFVSCSFDRNKTNLNIVTGQNPAHCQFVGCSFNHSVNFAVVATNIGPGAVFSACAFLPPNIYITNSQGFTFSACQMGWSPVGQQLTFDHSTNCCVLFDTSPFGVPTGYAIIYSNSCVNCFHVSGNTSTTSGITLDNANLTITNSIIASNLVAITTTSDNAAAGFLGEFFNSLVAVGSASGLSTTVASNITSISLTAGDWDVEGNVNYTTTSATVTASAAGISSTTGTLPTDGSELNSGVQVTLVSEKNSIPLPRKRISISGNTTVYLVGSATFSAGTVAVYGQINARRVR